MATATANIHSRHSQVEQIQMMNRHLFVAVNQVETGVIMLVYLDQAWRELRASVAAGEKNLDRETLAEAVLYGAGRRVRPVVMTAGATIAGLLPILFGQGTGSEVMSRLAAPMVGGMLSSVLLTLLVFPVIYLIWRGRGLPSR